jgi:uncharacterized protein (TIGR03435 family)
MAQLRDAERDAVVLRYFQNKNLREVGEALGIEERAAQKRVVRAVEKLRKFFARRGVMSTSAIIAGAITAHSVHAAPAVLAGSVISAAVTQGAAASGTTLILIKGALKIMAWTKAKTAIVTGVVVLLATGTATITVKKIHEHQENETYPWQVQNFSTALLDQVPPQVKIVPAKFPSGPMGWKNDKVMGIGQPLSSILPQVYGVNWSRTLCKVELPPGRYDFIANLPRDSAAALRQEIERKFELVSRRELMETDVLNLTVSDPRATGLKLAAAPPRGEGDSSSSRAGQFTCRHSRTSTLTYFLETCFRVPVLDKTGLTARYDIDLNWAEEDWTQRNLPALREALRDQLGLELVAGREPIEMLVIDRARN